MTSTKRTRSSAFPRRPKPKKWRNVDPIAFLDDGECSDQESVLPSNSKKEELSPQIPCIAEQTIVEKDVPKVLSPVPSIGEMNPEPIKPGVQFGYDPAFYEHFRTNFGML